MELVDRNGLKLLKETDFEHLQNLKTLFKQQRNTVAIIVQFTNENRPTANLMSKLWRISDKVLEEMKKIEEV